jgi:hypothetical protein
LHFESPNRLLRAQQFGRDPPPPIMEDDLYGLGLSIWQLYTGKIPHEDIAGDDLELRRDSIMEKQSTWPRFMTRRLVVLSQGFFAKAEPVFSVKGGGLSGAAHVLYIGNRIIHHAALLPRHPSTGISGSKNRPWRTTCHGRLGRNAGHSWRCG